MLTGFSKKVREAIAGRTSVPPTSTKPTSTKPSGPPLSTPPKSSGSARHQAETSSQFYFYEQARFLHRGNLGEIREFQGLAAEVVPEIEAATGALLLATGLSNDGIWGIWSLSDVSRLWAAMTVTGHDDGFARMQDLIVGESQNFYSVTNHHQPQAEPLKSYRYEMMTKPSGAAALQSVLAELNTTAHEDNWSWSVTMMSITGALYQCSRLWRCPADSPQPETPGIDTWYPAQYEPKR
jgi:hypothetical protein